MFIAAMISAVPYLALWEAGILPRWTTGWFIGGLAFFYGVTTVIPQKAERMLTDFRTALIIGSVDLYKWFVELGWTVEQARLSIEKLLSEQAEGVKNAEQHFERARADTHTSIEELIREGALVLERKRAFLSAHRKFRALFPQARPVRWYFSQVPSA